MLVLGRVLGTEVIAFGSEDRAAIDAALGDVMRDILDNAALPPWHNLSVW